MVFAVIEFQMNKKCVLNYRNKSILIKSQKTLRYLEIPISFGLNIPLDGRKDLNLEP